MNHGGKRFRLVASLCRRMTIAAMAVCVLASTWPAAAKEQPVAAEPVRRGLPLELVLAGINRGTFLSQAGPAQLILRHRIPNSRVACFWYPVGGGDEYFRYSDNCWMPLHTFIEQVGHFPEELGKKAQNETMNREVLAWAREFETLPRYDVLYLAGEPAVKISTDLNNWYNPKIDADKTRALQQHVREFVESGKTLVYVGPPPEKTAGSQATPLQEMLCVQPDAGAPVEESPALAGIPFELFTGWDQQKPVAPAGGQVLGRRLADGKLVPVAATWTAGKGRVFHFPLMVISGYTATPFVFPHAIDTDLDADAASLALWEQLAYWAVHGRRAYPAMVDAPALAAPVPAGKELVLPLHVRGAAGKLLATVHAPGPDGEPEWAGEAAVPAGDANGVRTVELRIPVGEYWRGGQHQLCVRAYSADAREFYHEARAALPVQPRLAVSVAADKRGCKTGEPIELRLSGLNRSDQPVNAQACVTVFDLDGRALFHGETAVALPPNAANEQALAQFPWTLPPTALRAYTFWARAQLRVGKQIAASATCRFYRLEKWNTRNQLNWGMASFGQLLYGPHLPPYLRMLEGMGMNSVNWTPPIRHMERWGWFGDENHSVWVMASMPKFIMEGDEAKLREYFRDTLRRGLAGQPDLVSPAVCIGSIGEETGYGGGWGTIWEWYISDTASPEGTRQFQRYLKSKYATIGDLNAAWQTQFKDFPEIVLLKKYLEQPAVPKMGKDTRQFFLDYAEWWNRIAQDELRAALPSPMTVYSFGNYLGISADLATEPKRENPPDQPGYTMAWWPYANLEYMRGTMWGFLAAHVGHQAGYVADWTVNYDLSFSHAALANRQFMAGAKRISPALLRAHPAGLIRSEANTQDGIGLVTTANGQPAADLTCSAFCNDDKRLFYFVCIRNEKRLTDGNYTLTFLPQGYSFYDGKTAQPIKTQAADGRTLVPFHLDPADGMVIVAVPYRVTRARIEAPKSVVAGDAFTVRLRLEADSPQVSQHVVELSAGDPDDRNVQAFYRTLPVAGSADVPLASAINDRPGTWLIKMTDLATGTTATAKLRITRNPAYGELPAFNLGWPSESLPARVVSHERFLDELARLAKTYTTPGGDRFALSFYQQYHGDTRHNLAVDLAAVDWRQHADALKAALKDGATVILTGEDLGIQPGLGFATYPHNEGHQVEVVEKIVRGAKPAGVPGRPSLLVYRIGKGELVIDRASWDAAIWKINDYVAYQKAWLQDLDTARKTAGR